MLGWTSDLPSLVGYGAVGCRLIGGSWTHRYSREPSLLRRLASGFYRWPGSVIAHKMSLMLAIPSRRLPSTTGRCR